jgi:glycine dehydrogenase subunit 1
MAGYVGHGPAQERDMLRAIGVSSFEDLLAGVPKSARQRAPVDIPPGMSEEELRRLFRGLGARNYDPDKVASFLGAGLYDHLIPAAIRQLTLRSEFYTAYTPYQAEVAQGTLATIYEFQSILCELTGMDVANASVYDGGSAAAEAMLLASSVTGRHRVFVSAGLHPHARQVMETYADGPGLDLVTVPLAADGRTDLAALHAALDGTIAGGSTSGGSTAGGRASGGSAAGGSGAGGNAAALVLQNPNFFGIVEDAGPLVQAAHTAGALAVISADLVSLGLLESPGALGADIAVGEAQSCGNPPQYGGPLCGYFAARKELVRRMPGRLVAEAKDQDGHRGFVLTLQTREQHIRRDKATSNICTNNNLVALGVTIYFTLLGPEGLRETADQCLQKAHYLEETLTAIPDVRRIHAGPFFQEFVLELPVPAGPVVARMLRDEGILVGLDLGRIDAARARQLLVAVTEKRTRAELDRYAEVLAKALRV